MSDDLISRQAAIDALENDKAELDRIIKGMSANDAQLDHFVAQHNQVVYDIEAIKQLPPAEPKRGTTTLKIGRTRNSVTMWYECAECGEPVDQEDAFCRRCGRGIIHE